MLTAPLGIRVSFAVNDVVVVALNVGDSPLPEFTRQPSTKNGKNDIWDSSTANEKT